MISSGFSLGWAMNPVQFGAKKKAETPKVDPNKPERLPLWTCITSNGDGSYSATTFKTQADADKYADVWMEKDGEGEANVQQISVYPSAEAAIKARFEYFA